MAANFWTSSHQKQLLDPDKVDVVQRLDKEKGLTLEEFRLIKIHMSIQALSRLNNVIRHPDALHQNNVIAYDNAVSALGKICQCHCDGIDAAKCPSYQMDQSLRHSTFLDQMDLVKLVAEKEELLKLKQKEIEQMKDKVLCSYGEMENVIGRAKREAENSKKFAIQSFAKSLLDVADNPGRASSARKDSFSKIDSSKDSVGAVPIVKTLLDGVEMTEKQLAEVFKKFGVEKFDPLNEQFDPNQHLAVFQMPDPSKPPGTVAAVLKAGYMLHDRVLRPAEVGVTEGSSDDTDQKASQLRL